MSLPVQYQGSPSLMTTTQDIIENAYLILNQSGVNSMASNGVYGDAGTRLFNQLSYADIGKNNWRFACKIQLLTQVENFVQPPLTQWTAAYYLPADFIRMYQLIPQGINYDIFNKQIYTYSFPQLQCEYQYWVPVSQWPPYYANYFTYKLANALATAVAVNATVKQQIQLDLQVAFNDALQAESQNAPRQPISNYPAINARFGTDYMNGLGGYYT